MKLLALLIAASNIVIPLATSALEEDRSFPASPFQPDLTPGYVLIEGDIQIRYEDYLRFRGRTGQPEATFGATTFWSGGVVPFEFQTTNPGAVSAANQTAATNAMNAIAIRAGVTFRAAVSQDANRIHFQDSSFNNSMVGMQGGVQIVNIHDWRTEIIICHELYHALGFWHEQSRSDRGNFITINYPNVCGSDTSNMCTDGTGPGQCCMCVDGSGNCVPCASQFDVQNGARTYGPYDFDSIMHYGPRSFTCNGLDTITVNPPFDVQWQGVIGQRTHFSYLDGITCRAIYRFANDRWLDRASTVQPLGLFDLPYTDSTLGSALARVPDGGTLFIKHANNYTATSTYTKTVTIEAPDGPVTFGR